MKLLDTSLLAFSLSASWSSVSMSTFISSISFALAASTFVELIVIHLKLAVDLRR